MSESYRESHQGKGSEYHDTFSVLPHRAMVWRMEQRLLVRLVKQLFAGRRPTYLDFACGTGRIIGHLASYVTHPVGVDVSASMLALARRGVPEAKFLEADLTTSDPLGDRSFDLITAFRFFPNAEPELRAGAIHALVKHLAPGGYLLFNNHKHDASLMRRLAILLGRTISPEEALRTGDRVLAQPEVDELVASVGLRIVSRHPIGVLPLTERHMVRPIWLVETLERGLSKLPLSVRLAQNIVHVCARTSDVECTGSLP